MNDSTPYLSGQLGHFAIPDTTPPGRPLHDRPNLRPVQHFALRGGKLKPLAADPLEGKLDEHGLQALPQECGYAAYRYLHVGSRGLLNIEVASKEVDFPVRICLELPGLGLCFWICGADGVDQVIADAEFLQEVFDDVGRKLGGYAWPLISRTLRPESSLLAQWQRACHTPK